MDDRMSYALAQGDPEVAAAVDHETLRQHEGLEMIASENFVSEAVLEAAGSVFTNKYAEGYPGRRYYGGCEFADVVENLARDRARNRSLAPNTPTCSRTRARRRMPQPTRRCCRRGTRSWAWTWRTAAI